MNNKSQKTSSCQMGQELDRISQLPETLIDMILSLMPIQDAIRTSILSSKWRYKWTRIPKLVFNDSIVIDESSKLVKIIDRVLLLHSGPVEKFVLSHHQYQASSDIDIWIKYLHKASIREFFLCIWKGSYKVPSSLFSCEDLTKLYLWNCSVTIPPTFSGFKNLRALNVHLVTQQELESFVSSCPLLEKLRLFNHQWKNLILDTPKINHLILLGSIQGISFKHTCSSPLFVLDVTSATGNVNLLTFFAPLRNITTLRLYRDAIKFLSLQEVPSVLVPLLLLKKLEISCVNFKNLKEILVILCLLRSAPNLNQVKFLATETGESDLGGGEIHDSPFTLAHLHSATLIGIGDTILEVGFIGILLSSSPALKKMTIKSSKISPTGNGEHNLLRNIMRLQFPSTKAQLIFL